MRLSFLLRVLTALFLGTATLTATNAKAWELVICADLNAPPFSSRDETGFENQVAQIIAEELDATVTYVWGPLARSFEFLREGDCDAVMGIPDGTDAVLGTITYYRSPYVFIYRSSDDYGLRTFDDPILRELKIGVMPSDSPAHHALLRRDLGANVILGTLDFATGNDRPFENVIAALVDGTIDVAVVWGPSGGYYAAQAPVEMTVTPVPPFEPPLIPMYLNMVMGVRHGDEFLRDMLDVAIVQRWDDIQAVLDELEIPRMDLVAPIITLDTGE